MGTRTLSPRFTRRTPCNEKAKFHWLFTWLLRRQVCCGFESHFSSSIFLKTPFLSKESFEKSMAVLSLERSNYGHGCFTFDETRTTLYRKWRNCQNYLWDTLFQIILLQRSYEREPWYESFRSLYPYFVFIWLIRDKSHLQEKCETLGITNESKSTPTIGCISLHSSSFYASDSCILLLESTSLTFGILRPCHEVSRTPFRLWCGRIKVKLDTHISIDCILVDISDSLWEIESFWNIYEFCANFWLEFSLYLTRYLPSDLILSISARRCPLISV